MGYIPNLPTEIIIWVSKLLDDIDDALRFARMLQVSELCFRPNERPIKDIKIHDCTFALVLLVRRVN